MNTNAINVQPLTLSEMNEIQGGGLADYVTAALAVGSALYLIGYAGGKAVYHATH